MGLFRFLYCALLLHVGMGASFVLPLVREGAGHQASLVFGLYFGAIVLAELVTYRVAAIRHWRFGVPASAVVYMASFVIMATVPPPGGLIVGRVIEGLAIGVRVPLLFRDAMTSDPKSRDRMLVAMGSLYAVGYVTGPFVADLALSVLSRGTALVVFGSVSLLISVAMEAVRPGGVGLEHEEPADAPPLRRFTLLFVAKFFYGFLLVSITAAAGPRLFSNRISFVFLGLAVVFTLGQSLAARLVGRVPLDVLAIWFASGLSLGCVAYGVWPGSVTLILVAFVHAALYFIGQRVVGLKPADSKTFALFSALSDPGSALGAISGRLGTRGAFVVAAVALVPIALEATRRTRATD
jgi:MFS family permease